jgi:hypothetical protein
MQEMEGTYYIIGDRVEKITFNKKGVYKLQISQGDIRYRTDGEDPTQDIGEYLQTASILNIVVKDNPIVFRAIRSGNENGILTIISIDNVQEE